MASKIALPYPGSVFDLFRRIRHLPLPMLLHSGGTGERYDILVAAPERILRGGPAFAEVTGCDGAVENVTGNPFDILRRQMTAMGFPEAGKPDGLPFTGGAVGYFAYDLARPVPPRADAIALPGMLLGIYRWALIVDHRARSCTLAIRDDCRAIDPERLLALLQADSEEKYNNKFQLESEFKSNFSKQDYIQAFARVMAYIQAGDCYQVNLSQQFRAACGGDSLDAYRRLQALVRAPLGAFIEDGGQAVLSFSPERFLKVRERRVLTQPIKGTRPRHPQPERDRAVADELRNSTKDRAENLMIVDLLRNDLGRVCRTGTVAVTKLFDIESFPNVHHMVSSIRGELAHAGDVFALLAACFPGGSITGTPKIRAMEIIDELETRPRSVYCGSIGYIGFDGSMDTNIGIRTLVRDGDIIYCWGGGGIVADSEADREYQETLDKISIFMNNLE